MSLGINTRITNTTEQPSTLNRGKTLYVGGTGPNNYTRIRDGIYFAEDGDTVYVYNDSAPYIEILKINKSINLIGEDRYTTLIDTYDSPEDAIIITADNVTVSGFRVGNLISGACAININSDNCLVYGNNLDYKLNMAIEIYGNNNVVKDNYIKTGGSAGVIIENGYYNTIADNYIQQSTIRARYCNAGYPNLIINNTIEDTSRWGIDLYIRCSYFEITKNRISYCLSDRPAVAIHLNNYCYNNSIHDNLIHNNTIGILLDFSCYDNRFYHNNLLDNNQNVKDKWSNIWDDGYFSGGNYWDDYEEKYPNAEPLPLKPWIWDTPYEIPGGDNKDMYPLVNQWPNSLSRTMPRNRIVTYNSLFLRFLEQFPILQKLLLLQR